VSVGMVHRVAGDADADRAHDSHGEVAVRAEPGVVAGAADNGRMHRGRRPAALHSSRPKARPRSAAGELFPVAGGDSAQLSGVDADREDLVHPAIWIMAVRVSRLLIVSLTLTCGLAQRLSAQSEQCARVRAQLLGVQSTFIGQALAPFHAAYSGPMSLVATGDHQLSQ